MSQTRDTKDDHHDVPPTMGAETSVDDWVDQDSRAAMSASVMMPTVSPASVIITAL